jgi:hypothetical protein
VWIPQCPDQQVLHDPYRTSFGWLNPTERLLFHSQQGEQQQQQQQEGSLWRCGPQRHDEEAKCPMRPNAGLGPAGGQTGLT